jgi:succinoglycan biosynthesis transport protein ExoP
MSLLRPVPRTTRSAAVTGDNPLAPEIYRQAYVGLTLPNDVTPVVIGVTSAISGEGRTTVAIGLARTLAEDLDMPVSLVEVDLDRPSLTAQFDIASAPGLCEVLRGEYRLDEVLRPVSDNLSVATAGNNGPDSARLMRQIPDLDPFHGDSGLQGIVILDLPPIINHSYAALAAGVADAIILVVRAAVTPHDIVREAIARLEDHAPQGVIFNGPRTVLPRWWPGRNI